MKAALIILAGLGLTACATGSVTQAQLNTITDKCGLDRTALQLQQDGSIRFQPPATAPTDAIDCALNTLRKEAGMKGKLGFIGNEASEDEMK